MRHTIGLYIKRLLLLALLLLLLLPAGQAKFNWLYTGELTGSDAEPAPRPELTWAALKSNDFQPALEHYIEDRLGFRPWFIKLRNQLAYSFLHETNDPNVLVGRNGILFERRPLEAYVGMDAVDNATVQRHIHHLRAVQDTLAKHGKLLVFVAAGSKASYEPENMPPYFRHYPRRESNYEKYTKAMQTAGINLVDLSRVIRQWKDTASYPLFPPYGTHWSTYGAVMTGDTLLRYLEHKLGRPLRKYHIKPGAVTEEPRNEDDDIGRTLNTWEPLAPRKLKYPEVVFEPLKPGEQLPTALFIGDSFVYTELYRYFIPVIDNNNSRFWFYNIYNKVIAWPDNPPEGRDMSVIDRKTQYLSHDLVLVMFTEYNMDARLDYGFSDDAYRLFVPYTHRDSLQVRAIARQIGQQPGWADYVWKKSSETGLSQEQILQQTAAARYDSIR